MVTLIVAYIVTPLTSAIISKQSVDLTVDMEVSNFNLVPLEDQVKTLTARFAYLAYRQQFLNGTHPRFTTDHHAILSFQPINLDAKDYVPGEVWTANTTMYSVDLN
jgi:hypothetical protein